MDLTRALKKTFLFESLTEGELQKIASFCRTLKVSKKGIVFHEGDSAEGFYVLSSGKVVVYKISEEGKEQVIHIVEQGQTFAEGAVFSGKSYPASAKTLTDSKIIYVPKEPFFTLLSENPEITPKILHSMSIWLKKLVDVIEDLSLKDVESRFLRFLVTRMEKKGIPIETDRIFELEVEKSVIASKINATPETFSRMLRRLIEKKILEVKRNKIRILKPEVLKKEA